MDTPSPQPDPSRRRLPTLFEVLSRQTAPPVDLFSFYIYMRDQQKSVDYLDFWLDVAQHMSLCRHFVRDLHRSTLIATPELEKAGSKRSSQVLDNFGVVNDPAGPSSYLNGSEKIKDQHLSAFLRQENDNGSANHSPQSSIGSQPRGSPPTRGSGDRAQTGERPPRASYMSNSPFHPSDSESPAGEVARADLRASAEKILYTFLLPGSEREIVLPPGILNDIIVHIEEDGRDDPEVFDAAKDYTFQAMERDAFPGFLGNKAFGNLIPTSLFLRLILGIVAIFGGLWGGFACIFLNLPRHIRCWLILPFTIGVYSLSTHQWKLDPILALLGLSEYTFFNFARVKEPFVRKLLITRAVTVLSTTVAIGVGLIVLFIFVPGKHLR